jgi:hypothetical protein
MKRAKVRRESSSVRREASAVSRNIGNLAADWFAGMTSAGFTDEQALELVARMIHTAMTSAASDGDE